MIILENYRDENKLSCKYYLDNKKFHDKNIAIFLTVITILLLSCPDLTFTVSIKFSLPPSCTVKNFRVYPNGDASIYRYRSTGRSITIILSRCQIRARMRNNKHKTFSIRKFIVIFFFRKLFTI